jgi:hypothetical protein
MFKSAARIGAAAAFCAASVGAIAQDGKTNRGSKEDQEACTPDVFRLCSFYIPDESKIVACLKQNKKRLSPACRKVMFD